MHVKITIVLVFAALGWAAMASAQQGKITVYADQVTNQISRHMTGACLEDVNHEVYGGLYSQMIFGESFQEPAPAVPLKSFSSYGGSWEAKDDVLMAAAGDGPKLVADGQELAAGEVGAGLYLPGGKGGNAGLIVRVSDAGIGADKFNGYEIALDPAGALVLGRHRQNWEPLRR